MRDLIPIQYPHTKSYQKEKFIINQSKINSAQSWCQTALKCIPQAK